ncbi:MAG: hypothetical protein ABI462_12775 [Ignavibacteria bacterium]
MKKLILTLIVLMVATTSKAVPGRQTLPLNVNTAGYTLEIIPDQQNNISIVRFIIPEEAIVKITVSDSYNRVMQVLTDGEMDNGSYCIYFKTDTGVAEGNLKYRMEVTNKENFDIIFTKEVVQTF